MEDEKIVAPWTMTYAQTKAWVGTYKIPVTIFKSDELEKELYAVCVQGTDYWLDAFDTKREAIEYCRKNVFKRR